jgi:DNA-binding transcriptional LysR family regulator
MSAKPGSALDAAELPLVLALARERTLAGAAERLDVDTSTVFRRLNELERRLKVRLFDRSPRGYRLTESGKRAAATAERIEAELHALDREITGQDQQLSGSLRVTSSETLSYAILPPLLAAFHRAHPGIQLTLAIDNRVFDLSRREADVALRTRRPLDRDLFGRKLAGIAWAFYGGLSHETSLRRRREKFEFEARTVIAWDEPSERIAASTWLEERVSSAQVVYRTNSLVNQLMAVRAGIGVALLPCYLADPEAELSRLAPPIPELQAELWIVTHKALKDTARVRACLKVVGDGIARQQSLFEGRAPPALTKGQRVDGS